MNKKSGQTLVASMIVIVIILVLIVVFFQLKPSTRKDKLGNTSVGLVRLSALDTKCKSDLQQVRLSIQTFHESNGDEGYPESLEATGLSSQMFTCPIGHERYVYDPKTGTVHCPHPGHEKY